MSLKSTNNVETNKYELEIEVSAEQFEEARRLAQIADKTGMNNPSKVVQMPTPEK